ncbi:MAG: ABC transporter permease, partial [Mesorhizobium sp.]
MGKNGSGAGVRRMTLRDYAIRYGFIVLLFGLVAYFAIAA